MIFGGHSGFSGNFQWPDAMNRVSTNGADIPFFKADLNGPCPVTQPALVETRFIASNRDGAGMMVG